MKINSQSEDRNSRNAARRLQGGHVLIEALLLVALATFICSSGFKAVCRQHQRNLKLQATIENVQAADGVGWILTETAEGNRVWTRRY